MTTPAQQEAPETVAPVIEGEVPASISQKDTLMVPNTTDDVTTTPDWKRDLVYSTPGVIDPPFVLSMLDRIDDQDEARAFIDQHVPTFPEPAYLPLPSWAVDGSSWTWDVHQWSRVLGAPHVLPSGGGFTVETLECVLADGTVVRDCPVLDVNLPVTDIMTIDEATHLSRLAALAATTLLTARSVWKDELVAGTPGLSDPKTTRSRIEGVDDPERVVAFVRESVAEQQRAFAAMPPLPSWAHGPFQTEQESPGVFSRTSWTRDRVFEEEGTGIEVGGCLAERTFPDGTLVQAPSVAVGNEVFTTGKAREIAAAIVEFADLVDGSVVGAVAA